MIAVDAFDELYNNLYDLIISDIMMPEVDGFEFAGKVREVNKHIPILFMSAKDDLPSKQKGFQLGIDDYMVKPIELAELEMRVRALLRRANIEMERKLTIGNLVLDVMLIHFNKMVEELGSIETLKTDFFSNVSHEFKTPLAVIYSNAQILQRQELNDKQQECVNNILNSSKRMSNLIQNMLKLNKLEKQTRTCTGKENFRAVRCDNYSREYAWKRFCIYRDTGKRE